LLGVVFSSHFLGNWLDWVLCLWE